MTSRTLSHHNSETGELSIHAAHGPVFKSVDQFYGSILFDETEKIFIGADGIKLSHAIQSAIREAEEVAYQAGRRAVLVEIRGCLNAEERK